MTNSPLDLPSLQYWLDFYFHKSVHGDSYYRNYYITKADRYARRIANLTSWWQEDRLIVYPQSDLST